MRKCVVLVPILAIAIAAPGCTGKKPTGKLTGTIVWNNKKVEAGTVTVVGEDNIQQASGPVSDGTFTIEDSPVGNVKIRYEPPMLPPNIGNEHLNIKDAKQFPDMSKQIDKLAGKGGDKGLTPKMEMTPEQKKIIEDLQEVPDRYRNWQKSGLTASVTANQETTTAIKMEGKKMAAPPQ